MKLKLYHIMLLMAIILSSCSRYELEGDKTIFIGNWNWEYTVGEYGDGGGIIWDQELLAQDYNNTYSMEFTDRGKIFLEKNQEVFDKGKARFLTWNTEDGQGKYSFDIKFDGDYTMFGFIWGDTIMLLDDAPSYFPPFDEYNAWRYVSYFVKQ